MSNGTHQSDPVDLEKVESKPDTLQSMDRKGTAMSDVSTLCQDKDFLYLTDEDREAHQLWLQYIPRAHPVSGVPVQTVFAGKKRPRYRGMVTFAVCGAFIITGTIVCFAHFKDQVKANSEQMISIYYGLLSLAAVLLSCNIASVLSVSLDKWRGILPRFVRRLDIVFILSCGQWSVIRMICTANHSYFTCLLSNVLQTLFSQIFSLAFAGGDVFSSYASIITSLASWYSVIPILIGTAFISTYLFCMASRIVYYPTEHDTVRRFVLGAAPGCYVVGAAQVSCIHRMREARIAYSKNSKDLEKNAYYLEHEIPLFGWEATHVTEHSTRAHNVQTYVLTDGSLDEVQRAMHWAVSTNENIYMQGYLECGYCACTMAQLLRCNIVIVQRSGYLAPAVVKRAKTKRFMNILHNLSTPWKATPCL